MAEFSECLEKIMERRNLSLSETAAQTGYLKSRLSYWVNEKHIPDNLETVRDLANRLQLSYLESEELKRAYEMDAWGPEAYECFMETIELLKELEKKGFEYSQKDKVGVESGEEQKKLPAFSAFDSRQEVLAGIRKILRFDAENEDRIIRFDIHRMPDELLDLLSGQNTNASFEIILHVEEADSEDRLYNIRMIKRFLQLFFSKKRVALYLSKEKEAEDLFERNRIFSHDFYLEMDRSMTYGMQNTSEEWLKYHLNYFEYQKREGDPIFNNRLEPLSVITELLVEWGEMYEITEQPCLGLALTREMMEEYIYRELPYRDQMIDEVLKKRNGLMEKYGTTHAFFYEEGLIEFMEKGRFTSFPYEIYRSLEMRTRCEVLQRAIAYAEEKKVIQYILKDKTFPFLKRTHIEFVKNLENKSNEVEKLLMEIDVSDDERQTIILEDGHMVDNFEGFFKYLEKSDYIWNAEETIQKMKDILSHYEKQIIEKE